MNRLEVAGLGMWSPYFSGWDEFTTGINTGDWHPESKLQPAAIPANERRRAPLSVKMAIEVMTQACEMASLDPAGTAVVFSSAMGDMQITDYLCRILSSAPRLVSPTRFHNSVHNAPTGYWSITSGSHAPANAVSAYTYTAPCAFLESAIQALEDGIPVLLVTQEMSAPPALYDTCPSDQPFSSAMILAPAGTCANPVASVGFSISEGPVDWPGMPQGLSQHLTGNFGAGLLPLLAAIAANNFKQENSPATMRFPVTPDSYIEISASAA